MTAATVTIRCEPVTKSDPVKRVWRGCEGCGDVGEWGCWGGCGGVEVCGEGGEGGEGGGGGTFHRAEIVLYSRPGPVHFLRLALPIQDRLDCLKFFQKVRGGFGPTPPWKKATDTLIPFVLKLETS